MMSKCRPYALCPFGDVSLYLSFPPIRCFLRWTGSSCDDCYCLVTPNFHGLMSSRFGTFDDAR